MPISFSAATVLQVIAFVIIGSAVCEIPDIISNFSDIVVPFNPSQLPTASPNVSNCVEEHKNWVGGFSAPRPPTRLEKIAAKTRMRNSWEMMGNLTFSVEQMRKQSSLLHPNFLYLVCNMRSFPFVSSALGAYYLHPQMHVSFK